jgi:hypothetical protein
MNVKLAVDTACMGVNSKPTPQSQKWITEKELARHLHVSQRHLVNLRKNGLPHILLGASVRYNLEEIEAYLCGTRRISSNVELIKCAPAVAGNPGGRP